MMIYIIDIYHVAMLSSSYIVHGSQQQQTCVAVNNAKSLRVIVVGVHIRIICDL